MQAKFKRLALRRQPRLRVRRFLREHVEDICAEHDAVARPVADPREHFKARDCKRPLAKILATPALVELPPEHERDFLHHIRCVRPRRHQPPHESANRRLMRCEEPEKVVVPLVVERRHEAWS